MSILAKLEESISSNELVLCIKGVEKYKLSNPWLETPTDLDTLFIQGFNEYIKEHADINKLNDEITQALILLCYQPVDLWWCIFFVHDYYFGFKNDVLLFSFNRVKVFGSINEFVEKHRASLIIDKSYVGYRFKNGLWEHIENMVMKINDKFPETSIKV